MNNRVEFEREVVSANIIIDPTSTDKKTARIDLIDQDGTIVKSILISAESFSFNMASVELKAAIY